MAAMLQQSEDAILCGAPDGTVLIWNRGAEKLYGYSADEMIGRSAAILFPPECDGEYQEVRRRLEAGSASSYAETERLRKDGKRIRVWTTVFPIMDAAGTVIGASCIARDVSD